MYKSKKIGVVVRAYNEEDFITSVIDSIPDFVDRIYIVDDASTDGTSRVISNLLQRNNRILIVNRQIRGGAGAAAISGLKRVLQEDIDIVAIMDGDGQMAPSVLGQFLDPLVLGKIDYTKGTRLSRREDKKEMPTWRAFGNCLLTGLTRIASGYWHISDPQNGYMAISRETLKKIDLDRMERGFVFENDLLVKLNVVGARVVNIPHPAVYRGQRSKIRYTSFIFETSWLLIKDSVWRLWMKYIYHPLIKTNTKNT